MEKVKSLFSNKKFLVALIIITTIGIVKVFLGFIYVKDEPKIIPEKTREDIRGTIKEVIAKPIAKLAPSIGNPIVNVAYKKPAESNAGTSSTSTENWKTYKNEEFGFELKYPEEWVAQKSGEEIYLGESEELNKAFAQKNSKETYWKGLVIISILENQNISNYISNSFDGTGVMVSDLNVGGKLLKKVVDSGPNRFGGGTGYYYYYQNGERLIELGLDYFMGDKEDEAKIEVFNNIVKTLIFN